MINAETIQLLVDLRVDLLRLWQQTEEQTEKDRLSDRLNKLDVVIQEIKKTYEQRQKLLRDIK